MLDLHAVSGTPGAATVLGSTFATVPSMDGQTAAGVPIAPGAILTMWGGLSPTADTIGAIKLTSQDMIDPLNGEHLVLGAASLLNVKVNWDNLPYRTGLRAVQMGTNTGVVNSAAFLIDTYADTKACMAPPRNAGNMVIPSPTTFGGALTTLVWGSAVFAPTNALPAGKYAILGAYVSAIANAAVIRFQHADFGQYTPGFPVSNFETISTATWDKIDKDDMLLTQAGYQFVYLSEMTGQPCVPVFSVTNAGTGLNIQMLSVQGDTPVVHLVLSKVA